MLKLLIQFGSKISACMAFGHADSQALSMYFKPWKSSSENVINQGDLKLKASTEPKPDLYCYRSHLNVSANWPDHSMLRLTL